MKDDHLFGQGGEELTGKIPVQYSVRGADPTGRGLAEAKQHLNTFLAKLRSSTLQQAQYRARLSVGGEVSISHIFGVTRVEVNLQPTTPSGGTPFVGGILMRFNVITNEAAYLNTGAPPVFTPLLAMQSSGKTPTLQGRPAVPGSPTATDWLVIQIHPTKSLSDAPIANGAVKIYRIADPKFGDIIEVNDQPGTYLVSTKTPGTEFYVCGKKMLYVPPLPDTIPIWGGPIINTTLPRTTTRLRTHRLEIPSFEEAAKADAIIIVAVIDKLYAIDTRQRSGATLATWQLLHTATIPAGFVPNDFGGEFSESGPPGTTTIRCHGTNGAGPCSEFSVTISAGGISGFLTLNDSGYIQTRQRSVHLQKSGRYETLPCPEHVDSFDFVYPSFSVADNTDTNYYRENFPDNSHIYSGFPDSLVSPGVPDSYNGRVKYSRYVAYKAQGFYETHHLQYDLLNEVHTELDRFLGGSIPTPPPYEVHIVTDGETDASNFLGYYTRLKGFGILTDLGASGITGIYDNQGGGFSRTDLFGYEGYGGVPQPTFLTYAEFFDLYGITGIPWIDGSNAGKTYATTLEFSAVHDPVNDGISGPSGPAISPGYAQPAFYEYKLNLDNTDPDPGIPKYPFTGPPVYPPETATRLYDGQPICFYPKRSAVFAVSETFTTTITFVHSLLGRDFSATETRSGELRVDEYLAHGLETNVDDFPTLTPITLDAVGTGYSPTDSGSYEKDPVTRFAYSAIDRHTSKLAWQTDRGRTGSWEVHEYLADVGFADQDGGELIDSADALEASLWLLKPDGTRLIGWDDFLALFPGTPAFGPTSNTSGVFNKAPPIGQWYLFYNDPEHPELDTPTLAQFEGRIFANSSYPNSFNHTTHPDLLVGYWNRSATGDGLTPKYPELKVPYASLDEYDIDTTTPSENYATERFGEFNELVARTQGCGPAYFSTNLFCVSDLIYRDLRTGGFVTQVHWTANAATGFATSSVLETFIGNATEVVPFKPILDEWIALGSDPGQSFTKIVMYPLGATTIDPHGRFSGLVPNALL